MGSISPRAIVELAEQQQQQGGDDCTWLISHLEMRDFFLYSAFIAEHRMFDLAGMPVNKKAAASIQWRSPFHDALTMNQWKRWAMGQTGLPLVDAAMMELQQTGYCSNRVRQNAASVLTKDLGIDWRAGAEWFQFLLEDHCVGANWGNWQYFAGVGGDPKHRHFRTVSQAKLYDPMGSYVSKWIPRLALLHSAQMKLEPWNFLDDWAMIVDPRTQYTWQDLQEQDKGSGDTLATNFGLMNP
jgi:deoxyribodipyrimidine photo-lyase